MTAARSAEAADGRVLRSIEQGVAWITLNRPETGNAVTAEMRQALVAWMEEASGDPLVRAVVLTGAGERGFCTGADLRPDGAGQTDGASQSGGSPAPSRPPGVPSRVVGDAARTIRTGWQRLVAAVLDCEKPVVAAVNATAAGAGCHLALACDLVVAAEEARFIEVFARRGIAPDAGGAYLLARLVGPQRAKELLFFGDDVGAAEALRLGMVNRVVPGPELAATAGSLATRLAAGPTIALGMAKALVNRALETDRATAFWEEAHAQELVTSTLDAQEGLASFAERRKPSFLGW